MRQGTRYVVQANKIVETSCVESNSGADAAIVGERSSNSNSKMIDPNNIETILKCFKVRDSTSCGIIPHTKTNERA